MDELQLRQRWRALLDDPGVEFAPQFAVADVVRRPERGPAGVVAGRVAGERRGDPRPLNLQWVARDDPYERHPGRVQGGERDHVVLDDDIRAYPLDDLQQVRLAVLRAV